MKVEGNEVWIISFVSELLPWLQGPLDLILKQPLFPIIEQEQPGRGCYRETSVPVPSPTSKSGWAYILFGHSWCPRSDRWVYLSAFLQQSQLSCHFELFWVTGQVERGRGWAFSPLPCLLRQLWGECQMLLVLSSAAFRARTGHCPEAANSDKGNGYSWVA